MAVFLSPTPSRTGLFALLAIGAVIPLFGAIFTCVVAFAPTTMRYELGADALVVEARLGPLGGAHTYPRETVRDAEAMTFPGGTRSFGTAIPGYCEGEWHVAGASARVVTNCGPAVVRLRAGDETLFLSPPDPAAFIADLQAGRTRVDALPPAPRGGFLGGLAVVVVGAGALTAWIFSRLPRGGLSYRIADGTLTVPAHLKPVSVALAGTRAHRGRLKGWRVAGTAIPGVLYLGGFRSDGPFHCAATRVEDGWWVESATRRVFVTPVDMEGFGRALVEAGVQIEGG